MKAKEKAFELVSKFGSKELALICLDEIEDWVERGFDTLDEIRKEINGYTFTIQRNKRKDVFLSNTIIDTKNKGFIGTRKQHFLTLKGAKNHALEMINEYEVFFSLQ